MSLLSYQLQTKNYQRVLGLDDRKFNALDVKYSDVNLLKQLQMLNPIIPVVNTGFWGTFEIINEIEAGSQPRYMNVYLAYNNTSLTSSEQINGGNSYTFSIAQTNRLPLPSSTLQLKITMQSGTQSTDANTTGFDITGSTQNPIDQENTINILVNENNINNGICSLTIIVSYEII